MFCPACGKQNDAPQRFCRACGKPLPQAKKISSELAPAAKDDDPYKTKVGMMFDPEMFKPVPQSPPVAQPPVVEDPFQTMVAVPAADFMPPPVSQDQIRTQITPATSATHQKPTAEVDGMQTVVAMPALNNPTSTRENPPTNDALDMMQTVVALPTISPNAATDPMATVVSMPVINSNPNEANVHLPVNPSYGNMPAQPNMGSVPYTPFSQYTEKKSPIVLYVIIGIIFFIVIAFGIIFLITQF